MMQLYCAACENVVWVEGNHPEDVVPCPQCRQPIYWLGRRKARPVAGSSSAPPSSDPHIVAAPGRVTSSSQSPHPMPEPAEADEPEKQASWEVPMEQDFSLPCPENVARYVALPYRPEGGVSPARLPLFAAAVAIGGAALGWLASLLGQACYIILLYPLAIGLGLAGLTVLAGQLARVRSPFLAGLTALLGGLLAIVVMHYLDYRRTMDILESESFRLPAEMAHRLRERPSFPGYLDAMAREGLTISGRDHGGLNLGYAGTYLYWGVELVLVLLLAALGGSTGAREPFCSNCQHWKEERFLGTLMDGGQALQGDLQRGNLAGLACFRPTSVGGPLVFTASICPYCGPASPIDLRVERNPRARLDPVSQNLPLHLTYPGEALTTLEEVFASPAVTASAELNRSLR